MENPSKIDMLVYLHNLNNNLLYIRHLAELAKEKRSHLDSLIEVIDRSLREIVSLSNLANPKLEIEQVNINRMLNKLVKIFRRRFPEVSFKTDLFKKLPSSPLHSEELKTVIVILLSNAITSIREAKRPQGEVLITSKIVPIDIFKWIVITVQDNGGGIPLKSMDYMFERGYSSWNGAGIGLYVTREILSLCGGSIEFASVVGAGAEFKIRLPSISRQ